MAGDLENILLDTDDNRCKTPGGEVHSPGKANGRCLCTIGEENLLFRFIDWMLLIRSISLLEFCCLLVVALGF